MRLRHILEATQTPYLSDYGYSLAPDILLGPLVEVQKFHNATVNDIYRHLSKLTGWIHRFLPNRVVEWLEPGTKVTTAVFGKAQTLSGTNWTQTRLKQANTIIMEYGGNQQIATSESIAGDGARREWPLQNKPIVTRPILSTSAQLSLVVPEGAGGAMVPTHVGIYGYDTLFEWTYREVDNTLVQSTSIVGISIPAKPVGWVAIANATVQLPGTVKVWDQDLVDLEGPREKLMEAPGVIDANAARELAQAELKGFTITPKELKLVTEEGLTWPGNSIEINLPHILATGMFLITGVSATETERSLRYTYTLLEGNEFTTTWQERVKNLFGGASSGSSVISGTVISSGGGGGGGGGGSILGTVGKIPLFTSSTAIGDSVLQQNNADQLYTTAALEASQGFRAQTYRGLTVGAIDAQFQNDAGVAAFEIPSGGRHARFHGDILGTRVISEFADLTLGSAGNAVYPLGNYQTHLGTTSRKWLTVHAAELWVEQLVAQESIATIGGSVLVAPTTTLIYDLPSAATSFYSKHNQMTVGDRVLMKAYGKFEVMIITFGPSLVETDVYFYTVTRDFDGSGPTDWFAGDAIVNTGQVGAGFMDLYSMRGTKSALEVGPTIVGNVRTGLSAVAWEPRWAIGNLRGLYGYATDTYGAAFGSNTGSWLKIDANKIVGGFGVQGASGLDGWQFWLEGGSAWFKGILTVQGAGGNVAMLDMSNVTTIDGGKITTNTLNANRIVAGTITGDRIAANAITATQIAANAITAVKIAASTITGDKIAAGSITATHISALTITGDMIAAGAITASKIGAGEIEASHIEAGTIVGSKIAANTITADKLSVSALSAITADLGTVTAGSIVVGGGDRLWLNDGGDGELAIGGSSKGSAPFKVDYNGTGMRISNIVCTTVWVQGTGAYLQLQFLAGGGDRAVRVSNTGDIYAA
jgi:hypothetical protein